MGQKVHPTAIRLGITEEYNSVWYSDSKDYADKLFTDIAVRTFLKKKLDNASVSKIKIERPADNAKVTIFTARPGIVIGRKGEDVEKLRHEISNIMNVPVQVNIEEIKKPELDAQIVADSISKQLEKRVMFRRAMKRAIQSAMKLGAKGIKISISGRLGGAEIARTEWQREGRVPLHTFRANINYATSEALTTYGILGVKVWIFKGEVLPGQKQIEETERSQNVGPKSPRRSRGGAK